MAQQLVADQLVEEAQRKTGLSRFDSESFREGLELFLSDYNANERPDVFVERTAADIVMALGNRLMVEVRGGNMEASAPGEVRIRQAADGHFWVDAELNGRPARFLICSSSEAARH